MDQEQTAGETRLIDRAGNVVDGKLTKDKLIIRVGAVVLLILMCSWVAQWTAFVLPNWRGDDFHTGGLWQICGHNDFEYKNITQTWCKSPATGVDVLCGPSSDPLHSRNITDVKLIPGPRREYKCQSIGDYIEDFKKVVCVEPYMDRSYCQDSQNDEVVTQIIVSRWFEAATTCLDMVFGISTLVFMLWPDKDPKKSRRNGLFALIGIILTPWFCFIDLFIQNKYWSRIGVGAFIKSDLEFLDVGAEIGIVTSTVDMVVQFAFLSWATRRHGWRVVGDHAELENTASGRMGPLMSMKSVKTANSRRDSSKAASAHRESRVEYM
ncbi:hypothetical protein BDR26DRAFT_871698 [Obelidium mucronatum]|nr:hypothetical protein BDR26DRAFT_871698 [Obelidium mucronatum]